jgi:subtilisin family serine protease
MTEMTARLFARRRLLAIGGVAAAGVVAAAVVTAVGTADAATRGSAQAGEIRAAGSPDAIRNSYIVVLKDSQISTAAVDSTAHSLTVKHGGAVKQTWDAALRGFELSASEATARTYAKDPRVAYVEANQTVHISATENNPPSYGLDRVDQRNLPLDHKYTFPTTAANVHAYIIDTGIRTTHQEFGGRASVGTDTVGDGRNGQDCNGHGTHVSGTVGGSTVGLAKAVKLVAVRVLDCNGSGTNAGVIKGVDWVTKNAIKPAVANMSLGGGASAALDAAVQRSINAGVTYAIAAGNENQNACNDSPARVGAAITVGATDANDNRASFSNFGTCVDIFAPGVNIVSSFISGNSNTARATLSGTSMATPHVTGASALVLGLHPNFTPAQVRDALVNNATPNKVKNPGTGSPNKLLFVTQQ